jgi:hypothetical protein
MPIYEVLVTDVTTYGVLYCVAGWDVNGKAMVRPEPPGANATSEVSRFWDGQWAGPGRYFNVGNVVQFEANPPPANFSFPHATEDRLFVNAIGQGPLHTVSAAQLAATVGVSMGVEAVFGGGLVRAPSGKAYVGKDFKGPSLGALTVAPDALSLYENTFNPNNPKLRAWLRDGQLRYDLAVTADAARTRWLNAGLGTLKADIAACTAVHVRLGLSRPFPQRPDECYAQINGLYLL